MVAGAYMTSILPIKKYAHQSAVLDFDEYAMVDPAQYVTYVGFTGAKVEGLCGEHGLDVADVRRWYDGYDLPAFSPGPAGPNHVGIYAPYSVMRACTRRRTGSYWPSTETYLELRRYVDMDFDGLQGDALRAIGDADYLMPVPKSERGIRGAPMPRTPRLTHPCDRQGRRKATRSRQRSRWATARSKLSTNWRNPLASK